MYTIHCGYYLPGLLYHACYILSRLPTGMHLPEDFKVVAWYGTLNGSIRLCEGNIASSSMRFSAIVTAGELHYRSSARLVFLNCSKAAVRDFA